MCEKQARRRKHNTIRLHLLKRNFMQAARTHKAHRGSTSCAIASLQRVKESRWQQQTGAEGRSVRPRRRETSSRLPRGQDNSTRRKKKKKQYRPPQRAETKAMVPWELRAHCSIARLANRREGLAEQHLEDFVILPHAVSGGFHA